jgi:hypothetical protein
MMAFILASGKGVRLEPYTMTIFKLLLPLEDMPIPGILLPQGAGFDSVWCCSMVGPYGTPHAQT